MKTSKRFTVRVKPDGTLLFVADDDLGEFVAARNGSYTRGGDVEPDGTQWKVDLSRVGGTVLPERFARRSDAIAAEVAYLNNHTELLENVLR